MEIKTLIRNECANYFSSFGSAGNNYCCLIDKPCVFYTEEKNPRCKYFEQSVLPLDKDLEFKYKMERGMSIHRTQKKCNRCSEQFISKSRNQIYCERCSELRKKEQAKLRKQKERSKKGSMSRFLTSETPINKG